MQYMVSPLGKRHPDSGAWQEWPLTDALEVAGPGDIVYVIAGDYLLANELTMRAGGTSECPLQICGLGEKPRDVTLNWTRRVEEGAWIFERPGIWRTTLLAEEAALIPRYGGFFRVAGVLTRLVSYDDSCDFRGERSGSGYVGPGTYVDGQTLYLRLESPDRSILYPAGVVTTGLDVPDWEIESVDPADADVCLINTGANKPAPGLSLSGSPGHVIFENLHFYNGGGTTVIADSVDDITFKNVVIDCPSDGVNLKDGSTRLHIVDSLIDGHMPAYLSRDVIKDKRRVLPGGSRCVSFEGSGVTIERSIIRNNFDGVSLFVGANTNGERWNAEVSACTLEGCRDDTIQISTSAVDVNIEDNLIIRCASGITREGSSGHVRKPSQAGRVFIHHNVISLAADYTWPVPNKLTESRYRTLTAFGTGHSLPLDTPPWKIYHNTVVEPGPLTPIVGGLPLSGGPARGNRPDPVKRADRAFRTQEVFNNIFWYTAPNATVGLKLALQGGHNILDGNVYAPNDNYFFRSDLGQPPWRAITLERFGAAVVEDGTGETLRDKSRSEVWERGWESVGAEGHFELDDDYRPSPDALVISRLVLSEIRAGWPGVNRSDNQYVGARAPGSSATP